LPFPDLEVFECFEVFGCFEVFECFFPFLRAREFFESFAGIS